MASSPTLPPPPGMDQQQDQSGPQGQSSPGAAPSPAQPSPGMDAGARMVLSIVSQLRSLAKAFPETSPHVQKINEIMPEIQAALMKHSQPGEAQAPPQ